MAPGTQVMVPATDPGCGAKKTEVAATIEQAKRCLKEVWGYDGFRGAQLAAIERLVCHGGSAACIMPTGGGKSLIYQVPAMLFPGLTICISPLIALMKDQVDALRIRGVPAATLDSTLSFSESAAVKKDVREGRLKLLYVAPERLNNEMFREMIMSIRRISLLAVDEAHCIAEWGHSFRPDYLKVARFAKEIGVERVLCLTATATPPVAKAICDGFGIPMETGLFRTPTYRPNLALRVVTANSFAEKLNVLVPFLQKRTGASIVYTTLQKDAEGLVKALRGAGVPADEVDVYHAGLQSEERTRVQEKFIQSQKGIVCSTIAFGMGIDKANIRQVVHLQLAKSLENYSQEVGRAGRDGLPSECMLFLSREDMPMLEGFARGNTPSQRSTESWLEEILEAKQDKGGYVVFNHYEQSKTHDITANTLNLLYAQLELNFGLIRATTPFYALYQLSGTSIAALQQNKTAAGSALCKHAKAGPKWITVDVTDVAVAEGVPREHLVSQIGKWERDMGLTVKASQVRNRYRVLPEGGLPRDAQTKKQIATQLYEELSKREEADVGRLRKVVSTATADGCIAATLAEYFGDKGSVPAGTCGLCTYCTTMKAVQFDPGHLTIVDEKRAKAVLDAVPFRDDARLLARVAFGIASPRTTGMKLAKAENGGVFGSMDNTPFTKLIEYFEAECAKAGYQNLRGAVSSGKSKALTSVSSSSVKRDHENAFGGRRGAQSSSVAKRGGGVRKLQR